ncbi:MAG: ABC transporter ATP-binding protein [Planctomycetes bacterium]|nr:ABC transporter ATP-binding protein [Planctomycetota bacterium]
MSAPNGSAPVLRVDGLDVFYGGIQALRGVSLDVRKGELVTLIGCNGAGKSTTLKTVSGMLKPKAGKVVFQEQPIEGRPSHDIVRRGLALCPEGRRIFPNLTVDENLDLGAYIRSDRAEIRSDRDKMRGLFPILAERAKQLAGTLSGGEQQMLAIARALMSRPKLLMLDEPSLGLAPKLVEQIFQVLANLKREHVTILLVEQNARQALQVADRGYVLETGRIVKDGPARALADDPDVRKAYLGG